MVTHTDRNTDQAGELDQFLTQPEATQTMYDAAKAAIGSDGPWRVAWSAMMEASDIPARLGASHHAELLELLVDADVELRGAGVAYKLRKRIESFLAKINGCRLGEMHGLASTFTNEEGELRCDFCGRPVQ